MTIPTREDALAALNNLKPDGIWAGPEESHPHNVLRSYIESHTGEPITYGVFDKAEKLRFVAPNEHDAHMALILSSADPDEFDVETMVRPLYASPVQPVLEWRDISTAPMDGTAVLVMDEGYMSIECFYQGNWEGTEKGSCQSFCHPTHWMPLPAPPLSIGDK